jgi:hypothetical protein
MPSTLQRSDYEDCLILLYFGRGKDNLSLCRRRAYGDFKRTLRGIGKRDVFPRAEEAQNRADEALNQMFATIGGTGALTQEKFDEWHRRSCERLAAIYRECGYSSFYLGHAQKWLNMTFKYIYVMGKQRISGFGHLYDLCHVPLDNILIDALQNNGFESLPCPWSRLDDYDTYLERQRWVRLWFRSMSSFDYGWAKGSRMIMEPWSIHLIILIVRSTSHRVHFLLRHRPNAHLRIGAAEAHWEGSTFLEPNDIRRRSGHSRYDEIARGNRRQWSVQLWI